MFTHPQQGVSKGDVLRLRQEVGAWLQKLRETAGLSQRDLAKLVGIGYYTFISQVESGRGRVPPAQIRAWAKALRVPSREFAMHLLKHYDPLSYEIIFDDNIVQYRTNNKTGEGDGDKEEAHENVSARLLKVEEHITRIEARLIRVERAIVRNERVKIHR